MSEWIFIVIFHCVVVVPTSTNAALLSSLIHNIMLSNMVSDYNLLNYSFNTFQNFFFPHSDVTFTVETWDKLVLKKKKKKEWNGGMKLMV